MEVTHRRVACDGLQYEALTVVTEFSRRQRLSDYEARAVKLINIVAEIHVAIRIGPGRQIHGAKLRPTFDLHVGAFAGLNHLVDATGIPSVLTIENPVYENLDLLDPDAPGTEVASTGGEEILGRSVMQIN